MKSGCRCHLVVLLVCLLSGLLKEAHAQGAFGMDGTADASAASGMMGMSGYNPGQGAAFVSAGTKASEEIRIVAAAGNASLCWGVVDARMGLANRVVGLQPCSPRSHSQKWLLRRVGANLQIHPALFSHECLELATQPGTGKEEAGGELEWSRLQAGHCHPRQSPLAARQSFRLDSKRRLSLATNQNLCIGASGDRPGSVFMAVVCDENPLQRIFMPAFSKSRDGSRWFTEVLYGGAEEPHCLGVGSNTLLAVEQCRYSGLALSRQLFTVLGGGDWVVLQPSAQWGQCIGLEHVEQDARGQMHEEAREAGHHIASQACSSDHSGQAWMFDDWDRLRVPDTDWCLSAPIASETVEGLLSLQRCANVKEQRFYVHPHQIAKQVAPEEMLGQAYGLGRGQESATLFGPYPSTPRVHAPAAPNVQQDPPTPATPTPAVPTSAGGQTGAAMGAAGQAGDQAGSASGAQPGQFSDGVKRGPPLADGQRRSEGDASVPGVSQSEFLNFCRKVEGQGASVKTLQAAGCPIPSSTPAPTPAATPTSTPSPTSTPVPVVPEPVPSPSPIQQPAPVTTPSSSAGATSPAPYQRPPPTWKRKSPPYNSNMQGTPSPPLATHQQRHLQEDPTASSASAPVKKKSGFFSPHVPVTTMHEHELAIVHYLLLGGSIVLVLAAAFVLIRVRIGQPRKLRKVPGPMQMMRNAGQKIPARIVPRPPATATAAAEDQYGPALSPTAHAKMVARSNGRFNSIPGLRSSVKARGGSNSEQGQFNL